MVTKIVSLPLLEKGYINLLYGFVEATVFLSITKTVSVLEALPLTSTPSS